MPNQSPASVLPLAPIPPAPLCVVAAMEVTGCSPELFLEDSRRGVATLARTVAIQLLRSRTLLGQIEVARLLQRSHSTVAAAWKRIDVLVERQDPQWAELMARANAKLDELNAKRRTKGAGRVKRARPVRAAAAGSPSPSV